MNKGEKLALVILPKYGFKNLQKQPLIDFSATYKGKKVQVEVKYRTKISNCIKLTKKQKEEADFVLICNENKHILLKVSGIHNWKPTEYRGCFDTNESDSFLL